MEIEKALIFIFGFMLGATLICFATWIDKGQNESRKDNYDQDWQ